jgi:hypothetical protein
VQWEQLLVGSQQELGVSNETVAALQQLLESTREAAAKKVHAA